ncbi:class I SAM-dependent methyltransferase [Streptomyces oryzae]|uniref:class I SAM-dependent methyltransferase n=1 Tax=Streptomyces oryzae TaxID=1434886 RepID=UPI001FFDF986|nr:methyltransferase domain-containing protein [Streptomyces oryzae]
MPMRAASIRWKSGHWVKSSWSQSRAHSMSSRDACAAAIRERSAAASSPRIRRSPGAAVLAEELRALGYDLLGARPGSSAVDVGCGAGRAVTDLTGRGVHALGADPDERMIAVARGRFPEADFRVAGAYELPLASTATCCWAPTSPRCRFRRTQGCSPAL